MGKRKILYGISGIGHGHSNRQAPIIDRLARAGHRLVIFAYQESYRFCRKAFGQRPNVSLLRISVPFWAGSERGLDFRATARRNAGQDFLGVNCRAMAQAERLIGRPDLAVTDYEPVTAQYAYAFDAPLVTIDQQSKFLFGRFPSRLAGQTCRDEIARLRMFFPQAADRFVCSFFSFPAQSAGPGRPPVIVPPTLKPAIAGLKRRPASGRPSLLVYLTSQRAFRQSLGQIVRVCGRLAEADWHVCLRRTDSLPRHRPDNVSFYRHGDRRFYDILGRCSGIVSTAGHTLLSEAMYLGIPVYAMPIDLYEQQLNAWAVAQGGFGLSARIVTDGRLSGFIRRLPEFAANIAADRGRLVRGLGQERIVRQLESRYLNG